MTAASARGAGRLLAAGLLSAAVLPIQAGQTRRVLMKDIVFEPRDITARVGDTVTWSNRDIVAHTASTPEGGFDVDVPPARSGSAVMRRAGRYTYICRYHPTMTGQIVVTP